MARFRKIDVRMRSDEKFRSLSAPQPNGQDCWIYLLTNRYTTSIPGLYAAFEETLARDLEWSPEGFRKGFREVSAKGMAKADWKAGLVFIPNAIKYDPPANPNVVKGWRAVWDELPECHLKREAYKHICDSLEPLGKGLRQAFEDGCRNGSGNGMANPEQEQEQEPEQEQEKKTSPSAPIRFDFSSLYAMYPRKEGKQKGDDACKAKITTQQDFDRFAAAVRNYAAKIRAERPEQKHVLLWSTFCNGRWIDYVAYQASLPEPRRTGMATPGTFTHDEDVTDKI